MKRDKITLSKDFMEAIQNVPDSRAYKRIMSAVLKYAFDGEETDLTGVEEVIFRLAKSSIDRNNKRFLNGCKGGRKTTKLEPNSNLTITKPEPNNNQTITKLEPNCNQIKTETEPNNNQTRTENQKEKEEKEKEKENSPIKENPPTPLKENIYPQEIKEKVKEEKEITPHRACARVEQIAFEERYRRFIDEHKWINEDYCGHSLLEIDFDLLSEEIERSSVLKQQTSLAWIARQWLRIKGGYYRDFEKPKRESGMDILAKLHEKYKQEEENETFQNSGIFGDN